MADFWWALFELSLVAKKLHFLSATDGVPLIAGLRQ